MKLAEKVLKLSERDDKGDAISALKLIKKTLPYIGDAIPKGSSMDSATANKAYETFVKFTEQLLGDIEKEGITEKTLKGLLNYVTIVDKKISPDLMKVLDRKQKNVRLAVDAIGNSVSYLNTIRRLNK